MNDLNIPDADGPVHDVGPGPTGTGEAGLKLFYADRRPRRAPPGNGFVNCTMELVLDRKPSLKIRPE